MSGRQKGKLGIAKLPPWLVRLPSILLALVSSRAELISAAKIRHKAKRGQRGGRGMAAKTVRGEFTFVAKEGGKGTAFIVAEPTSDLPGMTDLIAFDLNPGTNLETAKELARQMRQHITGISVTTK